MDGGSGLAVCRAVEREAVLALHGGHAVQAGDGGRGEDGEGESVLQAVVAVVSPALVVPLVRHTARE